MLDLFSANPQRHADGPAAGVFLPRGLPRTKQARMMAFLQKDPVARAKYMQEATTVGARAAKASVVSEQYNAAYQKLCAKWFGESSPYWAYMSALKDYHERHAIPLADEGDRTDKAMLDVFDIKYTGYKSVAPLQAVHEYLGAAFAIFQKRDLEPTRG